MGKYVLQIKYHAAKKEVSFKRFDDGEEILIKDNSALSKYVNMKGKFVLQDFGNRFFGDIAKMFDGINKVDIEAIMTKLDYEDFEQMIEDYNQYSEKECTFYPSLKSELPDMKKVYEEVKLFGEKAIKILEIHRKEFIYHNFNNSNVIKSAKSFEDQINNEIKNISEKLNSLNNNRVSLCFTGVYSAGKSALINALLGYKILPEDIKSETAKMFTIYSPENTNKEKIMFTLDDTYSEIQWNNIHGIFEFEKGPAENDIRKEIQNILTDGQGKHKHEQIKMILGKLNSYAEVSSEIIVEFPIPLDRDTFKFTIYDTPGTDSNYVEHRDVLTEALENQTQSILIFVAKPDGLEGAGNNALLSYLKEAEKNNSKTSIDISRSLFVINKVDGQSSNNRKTLQLGEIKSEEDEELTIKLEDKKLFFTSALYGYIARAVKNDIASFEEQTLLTVGKTILAMDGNPMSYCFRENRCASSEYLTKSMINRCEEALKIAKEYNNDATIVEICSGLYALETEILQYGEKYASAVKAFAIIDSVDRALTNLKDQANTLMDSTQLKIDEIERNINELRNTLCTLIESEYKKRSIPDKTKISNKVIKRLKINNEQLYDLVVVKAIKEIDKMLKKSFWGLGSVKFKDSDKIKIKNKINEIITDFKNEFMKERKIILKEERDNFINSVKQIIMNNGSISDSAKRFFLDIPNIEIQNSKKITDVDRIYNKNKKVTEGFFRTKNTLNKDLFMKDVQDNLLRPVASEMSDSYANDYQKSLERILNLIKDNYNKNLDKYSLYMKAMAEDKTAMEQLRQMIENAATELVECQKELDDVIWKN